MTKLVWNEGMSVGNNAIDNDHKNIIGVLSKLADSQDANVPDHLIEKTFVELEHYVIEHFAREEAILAKINYKDLPAHKKSHQSFIGKIALLKNQWLAKANSDVRSEIVTYLQTWIVEHILQEDLDYVPSLYSYNQIQEYRAQKSSRHPLLRIFSKKLAQHITISNRVFITTLSPVLVVFVLCFVLLKDSFERYQSMSLLLGLNTVISQVNAISHSLQSERGLSSGFASSNYQHFTEQLSARRQKTDEQITEFIALIDQQLASEVKASINYYVKDSRLSIDKLLHYRQSLDKGQLTAQQSNSAYSQLIAQLLSVSENLIHVNTHSLFVNDISAINSLILFKEHLGQIRALGMDVMESNDASIYHNKEISFLVGKQLNTLRSFGYSASQEQKHICADFCNGQLQQQLIEQYYQHIINNHSVTTRSQEWFLLMSQDIDSIRWVIDELINNFSEKVEQESTKLKNNYLLITLGLLVFMVASIIFALVLNYSIISPVRKLTYALNDMSAGQMHIQFKQTISNDEIADMQIAYEKLRRKLLQADVYKARVDDQQKEIQ